MTPADALRRKILDNSQLAGILGERVRPGVDGEPVGQRPYVLLWTVSNTVDNGVLDEAGCEFARVQVDVWADSRKQADDIARKITTVAPRFRGTVQVGEESLWIDGIRRLNGPRSTQVKIGPDQDVYIFGASSDYQVTYNSP